MTDNEIIKFMQCVMGNDANCSECRYQKVLPFPSCRRMCAKNALDLINRQKAEIERLEKEIKDKERAYNDEFCSRKEWQSKCRELLKEKQTTKSEAIKDNEIIKALKDEIRRANYIESYYIDCVYIGVFQNALDLINRQKAEIEGLQNENKSIRYCYEQAKSYNDKLAESCEKNCKKFNMTTRAEAIKSLRRG